MTSPSGRKYITSVVKRGDSSVGAGIRQAAKKGNSYPLFSDKKKGADFDLTLFFFCGKSRGEAYRPWWRDFPSRYDLRGWFLRLLTMPPGRRYSSAMVSRVDFSTGAVIQHVVEKGNSYPFYGIFFPGETHAWIMKLFDETVQLNPTDLKKLSGSRKPAALQELMDKSQGRLSVMLANLRKVEEVRIIEESARENISKSE